MNYGFFRVACISPKLKVADCSYNANQIVDCVKKAESLNIQFLLFPELSITSYTCQDLFLQETLQESAENALKFICEKTKSLKILFAVGLPIAIKNERYNCAAFCFGGKVVALVPKSYIPNYSEFYERRWFTPYTSDCVISINLGDDDFCDFADFDDAGDDGGLSDNVGGLTEKSRTSSDNAGGLSDNFQNIPFGTNIIIQDKKNPLIKIACEICEDLWVAHSPSTEHALEGATIIANLSASNEVVGKAAYRRTLVSSTSAKLYCAYLYANSSSDESSTDMVFSGHHIIALNGTIKAESKLFESSAKFLIADLDMERVIQDRLKSTTFAQCSKKNHDFDKSTYKTVNLELKENLFNLPENFSSQKLIGSLEKHPFVPEDNFIRKERCFEVIEMQAEGLAKRLRHINAQSAVLGLSGGLDSTLALLVACRAFDKCKISREKIYAITMPCFGTTDRTYNNACKLAQKVGATLKEIDIKKSVLQHFKDIGQDPEIHDVTYENCQARTRTLVLMDFANKTGGIVIGTGDLSELALGWCTYNGDHMSMYGVNSSIPKTLVRYLVNWFSDEALENGQNELCAVLKDILETPVSPELIPPSQGKISQKTEELVGPYELHDFFLYYVLRWGFSPQKIYFLSCQAFLGQKSDGTDETYTKEIIFKWLKSFYKRFFSQQFKRSCMPDGAKVGTVNLSPRGDWRMPSDASVSEWIKELDEIIVDAC